MAILAQQEHSLWLGNFDVEVSLELWLDEHDPLAHKTTELVQL
jgi:hypothetical protein